MKRLKHPIRAIREPFGTAGLIVAVVALVAALGGSALAATATLSGKQKKEVEKIAKKYAGKPGAAGPAGAAGTAGGPGKEGAKGESGATGLQGPAGPAGAKGPQGAQGESGFTATLPEGETETGTWSVAGEGGKENPGGPAGEGFQRVPISFAIPLEEPLAAADVTVVPEGTTGTGGCAGGTYADPTAVAGNLCVYITTLSPGATVFNPTFPIVTPEKQAQSRGAGKTGAILNLIETEEGTEGMGTWAVTAPE